MKRKYENRGRLMDAYVTALAEIAEGREKPMEYARSVLRQGPALLIERAKAIRNGQDTCAWEKLGPHYYHSDCGHTTLECILGKTYCSFCGRRIEQKLVEKSESGA